MSDPAGMLQRVPELELLAGVPRIQRALASGRPHKVYRAIWWSRWLGGLKTDQKALARTLLETRRLFLEPITKAPTLSTVNGIGGTIYGEHERDERDGTCVGTHFIVFLFVPVFPLAQYLYLSEGNHYRFFGKVPFSTAGPAGTRPASPTSSS